MKSVFVFFQLEFKRFFCAKNIIVLLLLLFLFSCGVHNGIKDFENTKNKVKEFQKHEALTFNRMTNYMLISNVGIRVLFVPQASVIFFTNPANFSDLAAEINTIAELHIYNNCQSDSIFKNESRFQFLFSSIILLLGSLIALFNGYNAIQNTGYLKFLSSLLPGKSVLFFIVLSRFILFTLSFLFIFLLMLGLVMIEGVQIPQNILSEFSGYIITAMIMILVSLGIGTIVGSLKKERFGSVTSLIAAWILVFFIIPFAYDSYVKEQGDQISSYYKIYENKMKIITDFERRAVEEHGRFEDNTKEENREVIEGYWNNEFKQVEAVENQFKNEMDDVIKSCNNLGLWFPTTFYNLVSNELSSRGYQSFRNFYSYLIILRRQFARHWFDHVYYKDPKILVSFVKEGEDQNLYHAQSRLPENFWKGVIINSVWVIILLFIGNFLFKRRIYPLLKKPEETDEIKFKLSPGDQISVIAYPRKANEPMVAQQIVNAYFGQARSFKGVIMVDDVDLNTKEKKNVLCLCSPDEFPEDIKPLDLIVFIKRRLKLTAEEFEKLKKSAGEQFLKKRFSKLEPMQKYDVLLAIMELDKWDAIILFNFAFGLPEDDHYDLCSKILEMDLKKAVLIDILTKGNMWFQPGKTFRVRFEKGKYVT